MVGDGILSTKSRKYDFFIRSYFHLSLCSTEKSILIKRLDEFMNNWTAKEAYLWIFRFFASAKCNSLVES